MKKNKKISKVIGWIAAALLAVILILCGTFCALWHNEISAIGSIEEIRVRNDGHMDGAVYRMDVKGGFYLEDFLAQGGAKSDGELIDFVTKKITKGLIDMGLENPEIGCSSFTAKTPEGDSLFGRNYDMKKTNTCIVYTEATEGRHATVSTVDLSFLGIDTETGITGIMDKITCLAAPYAPLDGMNDAGVSCGIYMTYQGDETVVATDQNTDKPDITSTTMLRIVLDYADSVDEAVELISQYDLHDSAKTSYHYMVADSSGKSAILEWVCGTDTTDTDGSKRRLVVTYNDSDESIGEKEGKAHYQWITNFVIQPGYYADGGDKKGFDRYEKLYEGLSETDGIVKDEKAAMDILASVGRRSWNNDDKNTCTVHSVVYNLTDKTALWVPNENYTDETAFFELTLAKEK